MRNRSEVGKKAKVITIFICFCSMLISAQQPYIPFQHFSSIDGLSHNQVLTILQDKQGFMWFGTLEGLNRFDGYEFTIFNHDANDSTSICDDNVSSIIEDHNGELWIGSAGGLSRYDRATNSFTSFVPDPSKDFAISQGRVNQILEDKNGNFWLAFATGFVDYFDRKQNKFNHFQIDKHLADVTALELDKEGNLWIGSQVGVTLMNTSHKIVTTFVNRMNDPMSLVHNNVKDIFKANDGTMWIATDGGLSVYNSEKGNFIQYKHNVEDANSLNLNTTKCLAQDKQGRLWIGMENGGLDIWDRKKNAFYHFSQNESDVRGISDNSIYSIFKDGHDNMWIGTHSKGINFYDAFRKPFVIYQNIPGSPTSLSHNIANAIAEQPNVGFWISTDGGGLNFFDEANGTFKSFKNQRDDKTSIPSDYVVDVIWDQTEHCVWMATWGGGLARFDTNTGRFTRYQHRENDPLSIASNNLWRLHKDAQGVLYVGTVGKGLSIYDEHASRFFNYGPSDGLAEENVVSIFLDAKNFLWVGSWGNGLTLIDVTTKKTVPLPKGINIRSVQSITTDAEDRVWISGYPGIQRYDPRTDSVFSLTTEDGLPATNINGMVDDTRGNLWLATNKGIVKYNLAEKKSNIFSVEDGLPTNQFSRVHRASNGKMYFGSVDGLIVFHPDSITQNPIAPIVVITDLKIFNKSVFAGDRNDILQNHISETKEIWLPFEYNFISLSFVALNYTSPQGNQYAYQLEGLDKDWVSATQQRSATYSGLDQGDYVFKVKASNNDGLWNEEGVKLIIHVMPPWWRTYWFRISMLLIVGALAIGFYRYRMRTIANQNKKLTALVEERTRELHEVNEAITDQNQILKERKEEIEKQNEELKESQEEILTQRDIVWAQNRKLEEAQAIIERQNQETLRQNENLEEEVQSRTKELLAYNQQLEQFAFISAHNLRAPVARILGLGNILDLSSKDPVDNKVVYQKMVSTAQELDRVVRDLNTILEIRKNNSSIVSSIDFAHELALVKRYIEKQIEDTGCVIVANFERAPFINSVKPYVESILQNLLSNAIKYRDPERPPIITLYTEQIENHICLTISDNGLGIDTELFKDKIFNLYQRFHNHVEGKGLGLYLIKTQILALGGKIELESTVNKGTTFRVYFRNSQS